MKLQIFYLVLIVLLNVEFTVSEKEENSYRKICHAIENEEATTILENHDICISNNVQNSLLTIFASSFLVTQLDASSIINYRHNCAASTDGGTLSSLPQDLIQNYLDTKIVFDPISEHRKNLARILCGKCKTSECILFSNNEFGNSSEVRNTMTKSLNNALMKYETAKGRLAQSLQVSSNTASIFISGEKCYSGLEYFHTVTQEIPRSVESIHLFISQAFRDSCVTLCSNEKKEAEVELESNSSFNHNSCFYGFRLMKFLKDFYSMKHVHLHTQTPPIEMLYKIKRSKYFVCISHNDCFLPSLINDHYISILSNTKIKPLEELILQEQILRKDNAILISSTSSLDFSSCRYLAGRKGKWVQDDMESAKQYQYDHIDAHYFGYAQVNFKPTPDIPYRPSTTYRWTEQNFPKCSLSLLATQELCQTLQALSLQRIMFVGDSLQFNMAQGFAKILGLEHTMCSGCKHFLSCTNSDSLKIELRFIRNDELIENDLPVSQEKKISNCHSYCYPWLDAYASSTKNTLLILNTGPHYKKLGKFQLVINHILASLDSLRRENDLVFFRTTAPGHDDCKRFDKPFTHYKQYLAIQPSQEHVYRWDQFSLFNSYLVSVLDERRRMKIQSRQHSNLTNNYMAHVELLDIYMMTVLRPDGHVSGSECSSGVCLRKYDCLHYNLPGPVDWWNHLLFSHLKSLQAEVEYKKI